MAIIYQEDRKIITINTENSTYQMMIDEYGVLLHLYYGKRMSGDAEHLLSYLDRGFSGNPGDVQEKRTYSLDVLPQEYPTLGTGDFRSTALNIKNSDGSENCSLRYVSHKITDEKYLLEGLPAVYADKDAQTLEIMMEDQAGNVCVKLLYGVLEKEDIITRSAIITNKGQESIYIEKAGSACIDFLFGKYDLISFHGKHMLERNFERRAIDHTNTVIGSVRGTSSHQQNPAVIIAEKDTTETMGNCYGVAFVYSGNFMFEAEKDQFGLTRTIMGLQSDLFHYELKNREEFIVPESILTFSAEGFSGISNRFHKCIRNHICRGEYQNKVRPILINSWEMAYFDFDGKKIIELAKDASELGIEMVVMDDGWFGKREDDNSGLGDWIVNEEKLGCTLGEMIEEINSFGMKFGIWIEPEMVSEDSDLYREHPDWAIGIPGRIPIRGRNQLLLDFSRKEVRDYVFAQICAVLDQGNVEYIKWEMNRSMTGVYSRTTLQGNVTYDYMLGVYDFLEKLIARYPKMLIEGCSGGGGRFDAGMLYYTPQIWCSDNTDAVNRLKIQYGTSFFYPVSTMGSHVSAVPNHQTGRITSMKTRGIVAMSGTFGYELDPKQLSDEEKKEVKQQVEKFKYFAELIQTGDYYRLSNPFEDEYTAWQIVSEDKLRVLFNIVFTQVYGNPDVTYVKLQGLDSDRIYVEKESGKEYFGSTLMEAGIQIPMVIGENQSCQMEFVVNSNCPE